MQGGEEEVGRLLAVDELQEMTVVVIKREDRPYAVSVWVQAIEEDFVYFLAGQINMAFIARRLAGGRLVDDTGKEIYVHEYLGEV